MPTLSAKHAELLEAAHRLDVERAVRHGVVSNGDNLAFEYRDTDGQPIYTKVLQTKALPSDSSWRIIGRDNRPYEFFNAPNLAAMTGDELVITDSEIGALSFMEVGIANVVAVPIGDVKPDPDAKPDPSRDAIYSFLWKDNKLRPDLAQFKKFRLAISPAPRPTYRDGLALRLGRPNCCLIDYPEGCSTANDVLCKFGPEKLREIGAAASPLVPNQLMSLSDIPDEELQKFNVGWAVLERHLCLVAPMFVVVTGRPNHGKSQWVVLGLVANVARLHGLKVALLQFEDRPKFIRKKLTRYAKAWAQHLKVPPEQWVRNTFMAISPSEEITEERDFNLAWLEGTIIEAATRHGCKIVVIDPWNEIEHMWGKNENEATYVNRAVRGLKKLARRLQIILIVVAHPTKEALAWEVIEDTDLYQIAGGAIWNNKCDVGIVVHADGNKPEETTTRAIRVVKSRDHQEYGAPGTVDMTLKSETDVWVSCEPHVAQERSKKKGKQA